MAMKLHLDLPDDVVRAIAQEVAAELRPLLAPKQEAPDAILSPDQLAAYLGVAKGWVYEQAALNAIPLFKVGKYLRFKKSTIDKWIETQSVPSSGPPSRPLRTLKAIK
jgi:excisionase family DNA binding protein